MSKSQSGKNFIEHYGTKGQKWGVRRSKKQLAKASGKSVKDMSDEDLKKAVTRMNMEQQFTRLSKGSGGNRARTAVAAGAAFVGGLALNVARNQVQNQANARIASAIAKKAAAKAARTATGT